MFAYQQLNLYHVPCIKSLKFSVFNAITCDKCFFVYNNEDAINWINLKVWGRIITMRILWKYEKRKTEFQKYERIKWTNCECKHIANACLCHSWFCDSWTYRLIFSFFSPVSVWHSCCVFNMYAFVLIRKYVESLWDVFLISH